MPRRARRGELRLRRQPPESQPRDAEGQTVNRRTVERQAPEEAKPGRSASRGTRVRARMPGQVVSDRMSVR